MKTRKTMYVVASGCDTVELFVNGRALGRNAAATDGAFPIPDRGVPASKESVATLAGEIVEALEEGKSVAVHFVGAPSGAALVHKFTDVEPSVARRRLATPEALLGMRCR